MQIRRLPRPLQQANILFPRTPRPSILTSLIKPQTQQRQLISNRPEPNPPTLPVKDGAAMSVAHQVAHQDAHQDLKASIESNTVQFPKEYQQIDESLTHYDILPGAQWGFVVFRTVYGLDSDATWARMLKLLHETVLETLTDSDQEDLLPRHEMTVIEDEKTLAGADSHTVRHAFRAWVADDLTPRLRDPNEYGGSAQVRSKLLSNDDHDQKHPVTFLPPRWNFCLFVDEACLRSLDASAGRLPVIKILTTDWQEDRVSTVAEGWEDGETDEDWEAVGWMYMEVWAYVEMYRELDNAFEWGEIYQRPYKGYVDS